MKGKITLDKKSKELNDFYVKALSKTFGKKLSKKIDITILVDKKPCSPNNYEIVASISPKKRVETIVDLGYRRRDFKNSLTDYVESTLCDFKQRYCCLLSPQSLKTHKVYLEVGDVIIKNRNKILMVLKDIYTDYTSKVFGSN